MDTFSIGGNSRYRKARHYRQEFRFDLENSGSQRLRPCGALHLRVKRV